jgi:DNA mismatch repair protein MutS
MTLIDEYLELQEKYEKKYGSKTVVLMEVGSFFEIYGVVRDSATDQLPAISRGRIYEVSEITNLNVTKKCDKQQPVTEKNPLMAGFPSASFDKWKDILLRYGYTIIKVEQEMVSGKKEPIRKLTEIMSPGVYMDTTNVTNHVMSIYIEEVQDHKSHLVRPLWFVGIASVDVTTGESYVYETHSTSDDSYRAADEIYRMVQMIRPVEMLIHYRPLQSSQSMQSSQSSANTNLERLIQSLELSNVTIHTNLYSSSEFAHFEQPKFQCEFLRRVFPVSRTKMLSPIEYLGLERYPFVIMSLVYLVEFCYEHNESYIDKWNKPIQWESSRFMELSYDAMEQLHIVPSSSKMNSHSSFTSSTTSIQSLWDVLDHSVTSMGRRKLRECIAHPIIDSDELNSRYGIVESLMKDRSYISIRKKMNMIVDLDRFHRRVALKLIHPHQWIALEVSHRNAIDAIHTYYTTISDSSSISTDQNDFLKQFADSVDSYSSQFVIEKMANMSRNQIGFSIFPRGSYPHIDAIDDAISFARRKIEAIQCELTFLITSERRPVENSVVEWKTTERDGDYLTTSTARGTQLKDKLKLRNSIQVRIENPGNPLDTVILSIPTNKIEFKATASAMRIVFPELEQIAFERIRNETLLNRQSMEIYDSLLEKLSDSYYDLWKQMSEEVGKCDYLCSFAKSASEYGYCRPQIRKNIVTDNMDIQDSSYLRVKDIRHPIIERLSSVLQYVSNDVELGIADSQGILLYGLNAVGKSSLMKSIGLSIVMAQCGSFVPATTFVYYPYTQICTRIQTRDNLFKGQSTFAVEMCELRSILKKSNSRTIVLGDELCSGTETTSGVAIVGATLVHLYKKQASFLFATHLHDLATLDEVTECKGILHKHLATEYDPSTKKIIYHRKLREGSGTAIYGLEVARALDLDADFLDLANQIRKRRMGLADTFVGHKTSQYNRQLIWNKCGVCGNPTEEVHHIKEQHTADKVTGMIGHHHKNDLHNLVQLCEGCHLNVHHGRLRIVGYRQTSEGTELHYEYISELEPGSKDEPTPSLSTSLSTPLSDSSIETVSNNDDKPDINNLIRGIYENVRSVRQSLKMDYMDYE